MDKKLNDDPRRSRRANVLFAASIEVQGASTPVKLRNLSTEGALIEGDSLPVEGSEVIFRRNELSVGGCVAWAARSSIRQGTGLHDVVSGARHQALLAQVRAVAEPFLEEGRAKPCQSART